MKKNVILILVLVLVTAIFAACSNSIQEEFYILPEDAIDVSQFCYCEAAAEEEVAGCSRASATNFHNYKKEKKGATTLADYRSANKDLTGCKIHILYRVKEDHLKNTIGYRVGGGFADALPIDQESDQWEMLVLDNGIVVERQENIIPEITLRHNIPKNYVIVFRNLITGFVYKAL